MGWTWFDRSVGCKKITATTPQNVMLRLLLGIKKKLKNFRSNRSGWTTQKTFSVRKILKDCTWLIRVLGKAKSWPKQYRSSRKYEQLRFFVFECKVFFRFDFSKVFVPKASFANQFSIFSLKIDWSVVWLVDWLGWKKMEIHLGPIRKTGGNISGPWILPSNFHFGRSFAQNLVLSAVSKNWMSGSAFKGTERSFLFCAISWCERPIVGFVIDTMPFFTFSVCSAAWLHQCVSTFWA